MSRVTQHLELLFPNGEQLVAVPVPAGVSFSLSCSFSSQKLVNGEGSTRVQG